MHRRVIVAASVALIAVVAGMLWMAYEAGRTSAFPRLVELQYVAGGPPSLLAPFSPDSSFPWSGDSLERKVTPELPGELVTFPESAFSIRIPEWWKSTDVQSFTAAPYRFANVRQAYLHEGESCALILAAEPRQSYEQSRYVGEINIEAPTGVEAIIGGMRYILSNHIPPNPATTTPIAFLGGGLYEPYVPYEFVKFFVAGGRSTDMLSLWLVSTVSSAPISDTCASEAQSIIQTFTRAFPAGPVTDGLVFLANDGFVQMGLSRLFVSNNTGTGVHTVEDLSFFPANASDFLFSIPTQSLWYIANDFQRTIVRLRFASDGMVTRTAYTKDSGVLTVPDEYVITDILPRDDGTIYYIAGTTGCLEYRGNCVASLFVYDDTRSSSRIVAKDIGDPNIVGLSVDGGELLVAHRDGDAGCWWSRYTRVLLADGATIGAGSFNGCVDETTGSTDSPAARGERELMMRYGGNRWDQTVNALMRRDGTMTPLFENNEDKWEDRLTTKISEKYNLMMIPLRVLLK